jgi:hypothetical protein
LKNKFCTGIAVSVFLLTGAALGDAGTLDALPQWTAPHWVIHVEDISQVFLRFGNSFLADNLLDAAPNRESLLEWAKNFPIESFSLVKGVMIDDEDTFQGAIRFTPDKREILSRLSDLSEEEDLEEALKGIFFDLFGVPPALRDGFSLMGDLPEEEKNLYEIDIKIDFPELSGWSPTIFVSPPQGEDGQTLLFGSSPEDVKKAQIVLENENERMTIKRRRPDHKNFAQLNDDDEGAMTKDLADGLPFEPRTGVSMELSFGLREKGIDFSLRHNLFGVVFGNADAKRPESAFSPAEPGLKFGGGQPWFTGLLSFVLTEDNFLDLLTAISTLSRDEALEFLREQGLDAAILTGAFRSLGVVLGGKSELGGRDIPGGYVFLSGGAEKMSALLPFFQAIFGNQFSHSFEAVTREGWELLYVLNEEYRSETRIPLYIGVKDGVLLMGSLSGDTLEEDPEIEWTNGENGKKFILRTQMNVEILASLLGSLGSLGSFFSSQPSEASELLTGLIETLGLEDLSSIHSGLFRGLAAIQEIKGIVLDMSDWESLNLSILT